MGWWRCLRWSKWQQAAKWYNERLANLDLVEVPFIAPSTTRMSLFVYVVRIKSLASRDEIMQRLADDGIPSRPYFTSIHLPPFYREKFGNKLGDFPVTEHLGDVSLALPFSSFMTESQTERVCAALHRGLQV